MPLTIMGLAGGRGNIWEIMITQNLMQRVKFPNERIRRDWPNSPKKGMGIGMGRVKPW